MLPLQVPTIPQVDTKVVSDFFANLFKGQNILYLLGFAIVVFAIAHIVIRIIHRIIDDFYARQVAVAERLLITEATIGLSKKFFKYAIYLIALIIVLQRVGIEVTALIAILGIGGFAVAFAAQETLANIIAGFVLMVDRPFEIGDRIRLGTAGDKTGDVIDIGLRSTRIKTLNNEIVSIPNAEFAKREIYNYTIRDRTYRLFLPMGISYDSEIPSARKAVEEAAAKSPYVVPDKKVDLLVKALGAYFIDLEARIWIKDAKKMNAATSDLYERIIQNFKKHHVEIPYPHTHVLQDRELHPEKYTGVSKKSKKSSGLY